MRRHKHKVMAKLGWPVVTYNSRGKAYHKYDPFTGEYYGFMRDRYKLRAISFPSHCWRDL